MKKVCARLSLYVVVIALVLGFREAKAADAQLLEIFIDARQPAYVTYQALTTDTPQLARSEMRSYSTLDGVTLVSWDLFRENVDRYIASGIRVNEYPRQKTALGILAILKAQPSRPVAITWNGGIATSFFDFQHAVDVFEAFQENPVQYDQDRESGMFGDSLNPDIQVRAILSGEVNAGF